MGMGMNIMLVNLDGVDDNDDDYNGGQLRDPSGLLKSSRHQTQSYSSPQMIELIDCTIGEKKKRRKSSQLFLQNNKLFTIHKVYLFLILQTIINMFSIFRGWLVLKAALLRCWIDKLIIGSTFEAWLSS